MARMLGIVTASIVGTFGLIVLQSESVQKKIPSADEMAAAVGFGLDQISLKGHKNTDDGDVFQALQIKTERSTWSWDTRAAKARIENLPWVDTVEFQRIYPNMLAISITERTPFAVWRTDAHHQLIDKTGRVLGPIGQHKTEGLPLIDGLGAATKAKSFLKLLAQYPEIKQRLSVAKLVGARRWSLALESNVTLELPASGEVAALSKIANTQEFRDLIADRDLVIDLRKRGRITLRRTPSTNKTSPPAKPGLANS